MRSLAKRMLQNTAASVAPWTWRRRSTPRLLILMYHRVLPKGHAALASEQAGMYVTPESLRMHIATLKRHFTIVHLDDWVHAVRAGEPVARNACAITFDDGWRDNFEYAWPVLRDAGVPTTIFLVSDLIGTTYRFWPNRLAALLSSTPAQDLQRALPPPLDGLLRDVFAGASAAPLGEVAIDRAIGACKALSDAELESLLDTLESRAGEFQAGRAGTAAAGRDLLSWNEIEIMAASGLVRYGSHTRHHCRLIESVAPEVLRDEIELSHHALAQRLGRDVTMFCYPNGDHCPAAVELVRAQYDGAVTTARGWNDLADDPYLLTRVGVHEDVASTERAFLARIAAWT